MNVEALQIFWPFLLFVIMLFIIGIYCISITFNLIRALLGVEILIKAVTLLIIIAGFVSGRTALAQAVVISLIVIEAVAITVAVGIVIGIHSHNNSLDTRKIVDTDK
ncbi:MAG: NADH-quinone oxidoreductase subunit K [Candidatus Omnitrophica bacterium]|nr:NADH-quinone oxidoreductase subunit K [Candidatus Omnitrophota bacterium]